MDSAGILTGLGYDATWFELVTTAHPDVLICPEGGQSQVHNGTYRATMPYKEIRSESLNALTPAEVKYVWPESGCMLLTNSYGAPNPILLPPPDDIPSGLYDAVATQVAEGMILLSQGGTGYSPSGTAYDIYADSSNTLTFSLPIMYDQISNTVELSALAAYSVNNGTTTTNEESSVAYTWSCTGVTFSANGTNNAKNTTATITSPGTYDFVCTATAGGLTAMSDISVTVAYGSSSSSSSSKSSLSSLSSNSSSSSSSSSSKSSLSSTQAVQAQAPVLKAL